MKLYEMRNEILALGEFAEEYELSPEVIRDTLESLELPFIDKANDIASLIKQLEAEADMHSKEAIAQREKSLRKLNRVCYLKKYLLDNMQAINKEKIETPQNTISLRASSRVLVDNDFFAWAKKDGTQFLRFKEPEANLTEIKATIQRGAIVPYAKIENIQNLQVK